VIFRNGNRYKYSRLISQVSSYSADRWKKLCLSYLFPYDSSERLNPKRFTHFSVHKIRSLFLLTVLISAFVIQAGTADDLTIGVRPELSAIGERVMVSGTTDAKDIIAVYLFVAGPGLDKRGVCLENLNLPAGHGYFTSAYVNQDGTWRYEWNTAYLAGRLVPGTYTLYVVNLPLGLPHSGSVSFARTNITFTKMPNPGLGPDVLPLCIVGITGAAIIMHRRKKD